MLLFKIASCLEASGAGGAGVLSFNGQTGAVTFTGGDIITLLGFTPISQADGDSRYVLKAGDTMTGALVHPVGTAALPSITFTGDLDTGIYHPAANTVGLSAGGALVFAVSPTGVNLTDALAYQYNSVNVIRAQTALNSYFFGPSGNLTMTGVSNTAVGFAAFIANTTGFQNSAFGDLALLSNTTGSNNAAFGKNALLFNTTGTDNLAIGTLALSANITGSNNSAHGISSLLNLTSGSDNTAIGRATGGGITTGSGNTIIGANVTGLAAALSNNIILADGAGNQRITVDSTGVVSIPIALTLGTAAPLSMTSGANQRAGDAVLVGGTVTVANTTVTANTRVFLTRRVTGGTIGFAVTYTVLAATSFTITSDNVLDTSTYSYLLIEVP